MRLLLMGDEFFSDHAVEFECGDNKLHGVISKPKHTFDRAVIIVVGGPQFRVGSHRQFVLLARYLASKGVLVLRFDYTGMGYSYGVPKQFFEVDSDIKSAIDYVEAEYPDLKDINLWGLCDAASAISFMAYTDSRIDGMVLLNPWVRSDASHTEAILKDYYKDRFLSVEVWKEFLSAPHKKIGSVLSFIFVLAVVSMNKVTSLFTNKAPEIEEIPIQERNDNLAEAVLTGMTRFKGKICLVLSENDLVADEFKREFDTNGWMSNTENAAKITIHSVPEADHTFSSAEWRNYAADLTMSFINDVR